MGRKPTTSVFTSSKSRHPKGPNKHNASGYAKRQARKAAKSGEGKSADRFDDDIYEYAPEQESDTRTARRSKVALDLDKDEELGAGFGFGGDGEQDMDMDDLRMKARLLGEGDTVDTDDDEEIDSDAAFEESDEERFAGFFGGKKKGSKSKKEKKQKSKVRFAEVDLNEDEEENGDFGRRKPVADGSESSEEEEESGEDDEFIDVLDVLDGRGEPQDEDEDTTKLSKASSHKQKPQDSDEDGSDDGQDEDDEDEDEEDDENISISLSDAEDDAADALDDLQNFVSSLDPSSTTSKKRRADDGEEHSGEPTATTQPKKRRILKEQTEAGEENEFRTKSAGLTLTDLLAPLSNSGTTTPSFEKSLKALHSSTSKGKGKKTTQTLSAPLPQRAQERIDREAAYEQTKTEVQKWSAAMKRIQEAEHLSFPLQHKETQGRTSNLELAAKFKPTTALESTISSLLASANLATDSSVLQTEENLLKAQPLSIEEVQQRRNELRKMRELMFRAEVKAKRVKKIKSKVYRRLKRKEREKGDVDMDMEDVDEEEARLRHETERARERATLRHKNTGKWAKKMMKRGGYDEDEGDEDGPVRSGRQEMEDMLARGETLRRKIAGKDDDDKDDDSGSDSDEDGEGGLSGAFDELRALRDEEEQQGDDGVKQKKGGSIFDMKFMKDAEARKRQEARAMADDFIREMGEEAGIEGEGDDGIDDANAEGGGILVSRSGGRMVFRPGTISTTASRPTVEKAPSDVSSTLKSASITSTPPSPTFTTTFMEATPSASTKRPLLSSESLQPTETPTNSNPWLATTSSAKAHRKNNEVIVDKDSSLMTKSKNKLKKNATKKEEAKARETDDAVVEIQADAVLKATATVKDVGKDDKISGKAKGKGKEKAKGKQVRVQAEEVNDQESDSDSDLNPELEAQEAALLAKKAKKGKGPTAFEQRDLVARAFAGDDVVKDFEEAKRREMAMDTPKEVDTTLPGWGSWGGTGTTKAPRKSHLIKRVAGISPESRADYKKSHVIISEKRDKKAAKYLVNDLPYPYTSKAQFERRMEQPLGPEWNTRTGFQKGTLPKVVKKMGTVIDPLEKLF
ncbi:hypothetical protein PM082_005790 [Marasmius tenuissimus]|nr:hypothetical protein PM082_005790 [Marasmius tenuissimus]